MRLFSAIEASASGLTAERLRLDLIASNLANAESTKTENGGAYRRKVALFTPNAARYSLRDRLARQCCERPRGVRVYGNAEDQSPLKRVYSPGHPEADEEGYVTYPNVDVVTEMVDMMAATRAYEANVTAIEAAKTMAQRALDLFRA